MRPPGPRRRRGGHRVPVPAPSPAPSAVPLHGAPSRCPAPVPARPTRGPGRLGAGRPPSRPGLPRRPGPAIAPWRALGPPYGHRDRGRAPPQARSRLMRRSRLTSTSSHRRLAVGRGQGPASRPATEMTNAPRSFTRTTPARGEPSTTSTATTSLSRIRSLSMFVGNTAGTGLPYLAPHRLTLTQRSAGDPQLLGLQSRAHHHPRRAATGRCARRRLAALFAALRDRLGQHLGAPRRTFQRARANLGARRAVGTERAASCP